MKEQKVYTHVESNLSKLKEQIDTYSAYYISEGWKIKQISVTAVPETDHQYSKALAVFLLERYKKKKNAK
jgi:hypothetical protein